MKFSENWLRTLVNPPFSSDELAHLLTMAGLEVESIEPVASVFDKVVVAEVLSVEKHPAADRLNICLVNASSKKNNQPLQIICGAPNVRAGIKVPCALVGAKLPDFVIKHAKLRGLESHGMLCSANELGLSAVTDGLLLLPDDAPIGADFRDYYALDDNIFTLKLTPNRADCLGLTGVAREVAAITTSTFIPLEIKPTSIGIDDTLKIDIAVPDACPLYCGRVIRDICLDVLAPPWLIRRLERSGVRSINAVVDVTNYVMLETGQPMHAFDLAKISGAIQVRYARSDEHMKLLNGNQIDLQSAMLLIADDKGPLALAGIMGGSDSGVTQATTDIFLESAFFNPAIISGKSFHLGFSSDSAHRFERGVDFAATRDVLEHATNLILEICGGKSGPVTEVKSILPQRSSVIVRVDRVKRVLGIEIDKDQITEFFQRLNFNFSVDGNVFYVMPPTYRFDLAIEEDFIEELARIYGYDHIPPGSPNLKLNMLPAPETERTKFQLQQILSARDYQEVINYAFVDAAWEADFTNNKTPVILKNPIASQMSTMRSSLVGGLIANLQFNLNRKQPRVRLFEIGCCFEITEGRYVQQENLAGLCYGDVMPEQWGVAARNIDFYDVKADIEALFWPCTINFEAISHPALHPGKGAQIMISNQKAGWIGELHPRWQKKYGLTKATVMFEVRTDLLTTRALPIAREVSKYPPIRRDIAVIVPNHINVHALLECMNTNKQSIISDINLFDIYRGKGMGDDEKSLAFRVLLQDTQKTLTDDEADSAVISLINILEHQFGAKLRN
ncbi:MAG: phenylalanine--tRNA ligase subunit beta [Nitrosomonas sp.]|nr:phenylalanine--tRNA ligase subunit beta [Nitrosomonas sp.]MDP1950070.1 phenylalanine--tRNA ligase subunit beta [Nitrosomonas sp.]